MSPTANAKATVLARSSLQSVPQFNQMQLRRCGPAGDVSRQSVWYGVVIWCAGLSEPPCEPAFLHRIR